MTSNIVRNYVSVSTRLIMMIMFSAEYLTNNKIPRWWGLKVNRKNYIFRISYLTYLIIGQVAKRLL